MDKRKIAIMIGSKSDLQQCLEGLRYLEQLAGAETESIEFCGIYINSIHRNTEDVLTTTSKLAHAGIDALIVGAGWANHLTGTVDAYLRYSLRNTSTHVFGVAFDDPNNSENTTAAILSIVCVPGTKTDYCGTGGEGFLNACIKAATADLPTITLPTPRSTEFMTLSTAIIMAEK